MNNNPGVEAEKALLGQLMRDDVAPEVIAKVEKKYFQIRGHAEIFESCCNLFDLNRQIEPVGVIDDLTKRNHIETIGGAEYLIDLMESYGTDYEYMCQIIKEAHIKRSIESAASEMLQDAKSGIDAGGLLDNAEKLIYNITKQSATRDPKLLPKALNSIMERISSGNEEIKGVATGFPDLDKMINVLKNNNLVIVAARPSMGKTSFALNVALNVALQQQTSVLLFSLEMDIDQLSNNCLAIHSGISAQDIQHSKVDQETYRTLCESHEALQQAQIYIDDSPGLSVREMRAKARRYSMHHNIGLIVVDYIQLIDGGSDGKKGENRQQEISSISRQLKALAREINVPVVALSQLNRQVDARDDHRPRMSDLRESGALEQDADLIMFLYRDDYYNKESPKQNLAEIIVAKHRNGPVGSVELAFIKEYMKFLCLSKRGY